MALSRKLLRQRANALGTPYSAAGHWLVVGLTKPAVTQNLISRAGHEMTMTHCEDDAGTSILLTNEDTGAELAFDVFTDTLKVVDGTGATVYEGGSDTLEAWMSTLTGNGA